MLKYGDSCGVSPKHQRRILKYQTRVEECGQDIRALDRFVDAQVTAFRKILKKYKVGMHCSIYHVVSRTIGGICLGGSAMAARSQLRCLAIVTAPCTLWRSADLG